MDALTSAILRMKAASALTYRLALLLRRDHSRPILRSLKEHSLRRLRGEKLPTVVDLSLTYRCQCNCVHCYADADARDTRNELSTEQWKAVINDCREIGAPLLILTGGDPLLRDDVCELIAHARALGLITRLATNGHLLTRDRVAALKRAGLTQAAVSIDSPDPETHDRLRGVSGAFEEAVQGLRNLREAGIPANILTYAARGNVSDGLERIIALGRRIGCMSVFILYPVMAGHWSEATEEILTEDEQARVRALQTWRMVHSEMPARDSLCCTCKTQMVGVTAQGEVAACPTSPYTMGNVLKQGLKQIWAHHAASFSVDHPGVCPMNTDWGRRALQVHAEKVREELGVETVPPGGPDQAPFGVTEQRGTGKAC